MATVIIHDDSVSLGNVTGSSRRDLRRYLGQETSGDAWLVATVKAVPTPTTEEFALDELLDSAADKTAYRNRWLYRVATGEERQVTEVDPDTGQVRPQRAFGTALVAGEEVELHRFKPSTIHQAISDGLSRCKRQEYVSLTLVDGQESYSLADLGYVTSPRDVVGVYTKGTTGAEEPFQEVPWANIQFIDDAWTVYLSPAVNGVGQGIELWLKVLKPFDVPLTDTSTTPCPSEWARPAIKVALYDLIIPALGASKERTRYDIDRADALRRFRHQSKLHQPQPARKIQFGTSQQWSLW